MPLTFLAPLFLLAAAAVAVPLILHLIHREQREATPFPSLMFLRRIPHRSTRRRRLRDLPLLALRVLVVLLLAGAFARPLFESSPAAAGGSDGPRELVLLLDRSFSMGRTGAWDRALAAARAELAQVTAGDRVSLVAFDAGAAALAPPGDDVTRLHALLDEVRPGAGTTRFDPALRLAGSLVAGSPLARREVVVISDLQRLGAGAGIEAKLPPGTQLRAVPVTAGAESNLAISGVSFARERFEGQERVTATARVVNPGPTAMEAVITFELGGRALGTRTLAIEPHGATQVELPAFTLAAATRGRVRLAPDALAADDAWHFALTPDQAVRVLVIAPDAASALFVERALAVAPEPGYAVTVRPALPASLAGFHVAILNGGALPSGAALDALAEFVARGGGVLAAVGPGSPNTEAAAGLLPGPAGTLVDRTRTGGARLGYVDLEHAALELFRAPRSGDLTAPRFYRYRPLQLPLAADSAVRVLARFDDGSVALAERRVGQGRVLGFASTLDRTWNDLAVQPIFVPLLHQLVGYAAGVATPSPAHTVGTVVDARAAAGAAAEVELLAVAPSGTRVHLAAGERALELTEAGWYTVRNAARAGEVLGVIASNSDARESEPAALAAEELVAAATTPGATAAPVQAGLAAPADERERRQALWWYLLLGAAALLAAETVFSNRRARAAARLREAR